MTSQSQVEIARREKRAATLLVAADGTVLRASDSAARVLGYEPSELEGLPLAAIASEGAALAASGVSGAPEVPDASRENTVTFVKKDGSRVQLHIDLSPSKGGNQLTLTSPEAHHPAAPAKPDPSAPPIALASAVAAAGSVTELVRLTADIMSETLSAEFAAVLRAVPGAGLFEVEAATSRDGLNTPYAGQLLRMPPSLFPEPGVVVAFRSLDSAGVLDPPEILPGSEATAVIAVRLPAADDGRLLICAESAEREWTGSDSAAMSTIADMLAHAIATLGHTRAAVHARSQMAVYRSIAAAAESARSQNEFMRSAFDILSAEIPLTAIEVHGVDLATSRCQVVATSHDETLLAPAADWALSSSPHALVAKAHHPLVLNRDTPGHQQFAPAFVKQWRQTGARSIILVPLKSRGELCGVLVAAASTNDGLSGNAAATLQDLASIFTQASGLTGRGFVRERAHLRKTSAETIPPDLLLALTRAAGDSPDTETLFASASEWLLEIIHCSAVTCGAFSRDTSEYTRVYAYDPSATELEVGVKIRLDAAEADALAVPALGVAEPGARMGAKRAMRAPVLAGKNVIGAITVWPIEGSEFTRNELASLEQACEFLAGPLAKSLEAEASTAAGSNSERELRATRQFLDTILNTAPVALINLDANGVCTNVQGHGLDLFGIKQEILLGRSIFELTGRLPELEDAVRQALKGIAGRVHAALGPHSAALWVQPVTGPDGMTTGATIVGFDISERVRGRRARAEVKQLQTADRERTRIIGDVAHELRTPLTSIVAFTEILSVNEPENLTPQQSHALSVIQKSSERLRRLIGDLQNTSRHESETFGLELSQVDVNSLLRDVAESQEPMVTAANQKLTQNLLEAPHAVRADRLRLTQVLTNLLTNASKYSPDGSTVTLGARIENGDLLITVADDGPGIPEEHLGRVFDDLYRVPNGEALSIEGSGRGLPISKKIMDLHGGQIEMKSVVGSGTTVTLRLPGARPTRKAVAKSASAPKARRRRKRKT